jgi:hypothetical protein
MHYSSSFPPYTVLLLRLLFSPHQCNVCTQPEHEGQTPQHPPAHGCVLHGIREGIQSRVDIEDLGELMEESESEMDTVHVHVRYSHTYIKVGGWLWWV